MTGRIPLAATAPAVPLLAAIALWAECARTIVIMDGSGLDVGQIEGRTKLEIARETAAEVLGAKLVEATFRADTGGLELGVAWSAVPVPGQDLPPEAWAKQEPVYGPITELFRVRITPTGPNDFLIPTCAALSPAGEDPGNLEEATPVPARTTVSLTIPRASPSCCPPAGHRTCPSSPRPRVAWQRRRRPSPSPALTASCCSSIQFAGSRSTAPAAGPRWAISACSAPPMAWR